MHPHNTIGVFVDPELGVEYEYQRVAPVDGWMDGIGLIGVCVIPFFLLSSFFSPSQSLRAFFPISLPSILLE